MTCMHHKRVTKVIMGLLRRPRGAAGIKLHYRGTCREFKGVNVGWVPILEPGKSVQEG